MVFNMCAFVRQATAAKKEVDQAGQLLHRGRRKAKSQGSILRGLKGLHNYGHIGLGGTNGGASNGKQMDGEMDSGVLTGTWRAQGFRVTLHTNIAHPAERGRLGVYRGMEKEMETTSLFGDKA